MLTNLLAEMASIDQTEVTAPAPAADGSIERAVIAVSVLTGGFAFVPLPVIPELSVTALRVLMIRWLARQRGVSISHVDAAVLCRDPSISISRLGGTAILSLLTRAAWRSVARLALFAFRTSDAADTYLLGAFFDAYCRSHATGTTISNDDALRVRQAIQLAVLQARRELVHHGFQRVVKDMRGLTQFHRRHKEPSIPGGEAGLEAQPVTGGVLSQLVDGVQARLSRGRALSRATLDRAFEQAWADVGRR